MSMNINEGLDKIREIVYEQGEKEYLTTDILVSTVLTFPSLLIADADGDVDEDERIFLMSLAQNFIDDYDSNCEKSRLKVAECYRLFLKLLLLNDMHKKFILTSISEFCRYNPDAKRKIIDSMYGVAYSSDGLSEVEKKEIDRIKNILSENNWYSEIQ